VTRPFPFLLLPGLLASRNRARRRERGDLARLALFGGVGTLVALALFTMAFWVTTRLGSYEEFGDFLVRLALSWLFLTFLSFLAFSSLVATLTTFFLSEDLRLLLAAPVSGERLFWARYLRTAGQAGWMVVAFLVPVLFGLGTARCAGWGYFLTLVAVVVPFVLIPVALGACVTLGLVNVFPARRTRDLLMLTGLLFVVVLVLLLRALRPERLLSVQTLPDITGFFAALQTPVTPLLPSFWAGEAVFAALQGRVDGLHLAALWTTALALGVLTRATFGRYFFAGYSRAQEAHKLRFTRLDLLDRLANWLPAAPATRHLLVKDLKSFLRDAAQWSQLLLLLALMVVYLFNFRLLDPQHNPYMGRLVKNFFAFLNLGLASFVLAAVSVRFVFPAVSAEGHAFWIVRTAPVSMRSFLWSKFWTGLVPMLLLAEVLTVVSNQLLGAEPVLKLLAAVAVFFMTFALVGLATGMGAVYPRFAAENLTQVAGSYGGIAYMVLAVGFILVEILLLAWPASRFLWHAYRGVPLPPALLPPMLLCLAAALALCLVTFWLPMRRGVGALERLGG
jgi:ABC-2 type transport system permease protein